MVKGERASGPSGPRRKGRRKGKRVGGFVGRLLQGVRIQDALGVRDQHLVPRWVRSRADHKPVADDEGRASAADELGLVRVPVACGQRREGDVVDHRIRPAARRDRQLNGQRRQASRSRRNQQRPVRSITGSPDVDTHHTRSLTRGRQQAGYHHV